MSTLKNAIILILAFALSAVAFFTRPTEEDFRHYLLRTASADGKSDKRVNDQPPDVQFKDRFLWVEVQVSGKVRYTGVFDHWFDHGSRELPQRS